MQVFHFTWWVRLVVVSLALSLFCASSVAQQRRDGAYFCTEEFVGGLSYNENTKKWESSRFKPHRKFVLRLKFIQAQSKKKSYGEYNYAEYETTVTGAGETFAAPCTSGTSPVERLSYEVMSCQALFMDYHFHFKTNRFIRAFLFGYFSGVDNNDDTPSVAGGICTKID